MKITRQLLTITVLLIVIGGFLYFFNNDQEQVLPESVDDHQVSDSGKLIDYEKDLDLGSSIYEAEMATSWVKWIGSNVLGKEYYGTIGLLTGVMVVSENNELIKGQFVIDMDEMVVTNIEDQESNDLFIKHMKNEDFFLVDKYPVASLVITSIGLSPRSDFPYFPKGHYFLGMGIQKYPTAKLK